jgi:hypothetical protein
LGICAAAAMRACKGDAMNRRSKYPSRKERDVQVSLADRMAKFDVLYVPSIHDPDNNTEGHSEINSRCLESRPADHTQE